MTLAIKMEHGGLEQQVLKRLSDTGKLRDKSSEIREQFQARVDGSGSYGQRVLLDGRFRRHLV